MVSFTSVRHHASRLDQNIPNFAKGGGEVPPFGKKPNYFLAVTKLSLPNHDVHLVIRPIHAVTK